MRFSDAEGHKVVSTSTADTVGKVHDYVVDPNGPRVAALLLKKTDKGVGDTLRWNDIVAFGADAVTVESAEKITEGADDLAALLEKRNHLHKKRVLSTVGDELGSVKDLDFDPSTGLIAYLILDDKAKTEIAGSRLVGVGSYAVVVQADVPLAAPVQTNQAAQAAAATAAPAGIVSPPPPVPSTPLGVDAAQRASYPPTS